MGVTDIHFDLTYKINQVNMKLAIAVLVMLPLVFGAPQQKRILLDSLGLDTAHLHDVQQQIYNALGADATEQMCEAECHKLAHDTLFDFGCDLACKTFQQFANKLPKDPTTPA